MARSHRRRATRDDWTRWGLMLASAAIVILAVGAVALAIRS